MLAGVVLAPSAVEGSPAASSATGDPIYLQTCGGPLLRFDTGTKPVGGSPCSTIELNTFSLSLVASSAPKALASGIASRQGTTVNEADATMPASQESVGLFSMMADGARAKSWTVSFTKIHNIYLNIQFLDVVLTSWTLSDLIPRAARRTSRSDR